MRILGSESGPASSSISPPRTLGLVMVAFGVLPLLLGVYILVKAGSPTFVFIGVGVIVSGLLVTAGKRAGLIVYGITFVVIVFAALLEEGPSVGIVTQRILLPAIVALLLLRKETRARLR